MDRLVKQLTNGKHEILFETRTENLKELKERLLVMKFVFITFTKTIGRTELGINVDEKQTLVESVDFENGIGKIHVEGTCELNYHKVRCIADIDLKTRQGKGYLKLEDEDVLESTKLNAVN